MLSQSAADRLIRELADSGRRATDDEIARIVARMATVPFATDIVVVRQRDRGVRHEGQVLGARADALTYHLIKRVVIEGQWAPGTTADDYVADLRRAIREPSARVGVFVRRGGYLAATITLTERILSPTRRGANTLPNLLVIYSADRGIIISGYQFSALDRVSIPPEVRWLR